MEFDLIIRGGTVIDGSGAPGRPAEVGVKAERIEALESRIDAPAVRLIDAKGCVIAPGFIDIKTHSDFTLPLNPRAESKVRQGVTTEVIGHCGFSLRAGAGRAKPRRWSEYLAPSAPWLDFRRHLGFAEYTSGHLSGDFRSTAVMLVGHNTLRLMTMGLENRPPAPDELDAHEATAWRTR